MSRLDALVARLFRGRSDGMEPVLLDRHRIYILPSAGGLRFSLMLATMLLAAINYNLALGHALVFLLVGIGLAGMLHTFRNLYGLTIAPGRCEPVFVGETAYFSLLFGNDRMLPRPALELRAGNGEPVLAMIGGDSTATINLPVPATGRGWLELPRVRLATRSPLGLFTAWAYLRPAMRCLVYPQPIFNPLPPASPSPGGGERRGEAGDVDFAGFRDRQPADSRRHVAWKHSARRPVDAPLLVKQFAGGSEESLMLDWSACEPGQPPETRLGILAGWVLAAENAGLGYGLSLPSINIPPGSGGPHRQHCLEALALYRP